MRETIKIGPVELDLQEQLVLAGVAPSLSLITERRGGKRLVGYKVMRYMNGRAVSSADSRIGFKLRKGMTVRMPGQGIFLTPRKQYAIDYYGDIHDEEVLLKLEFDPETITLGNLDDREPEVAVPQARLVDFKVRREDEEW